MSDAGAGRERRRSAGWAVISPERFLLLVGVPLGLAFALLAPAWSGYDESTHFARSHDIAAGNVFPGDTPDGTGSMLPQAFRDDQDLVGAAWLFDGRAPFSFATVGDLLDSEPGDDRSYFFDTRPTTASTPVAYLPSAIGMVVPVAFDAPLVVTLWLGRLANLAVYLAIAWFAVRLAAAFRWTLVAAALVPLNLALGATVTPDGPTIAAVLLVVAVWTRVERRVLVARAAAVEVGAAGLLLALCKPPYLLVLAVFPALWLVRRRDAMTTWAAGAGTAVLGLGLALSLGASSNNYRAATETLIDSVEYQPDLQRERLLGDPIGFVWTAVQNWFGDLDDYLQIWIRQLGFWRSDLPILGAWAVVLVVLAAALRLDADDYARLRAWGRGMHATLAVGMILVLYASSYIYFDDTVDGDRIGRQMARYVIPITAPAMLGLLPRSAPVLDALRVRVTPGRAQVALAAAYAAAGLFAALTWVWLGTA